MNPDSNPGSPLPDDDANNFEPDVFDDDIIDLTSGEPVEEGSSALSFSGRVGPGFSGGSSPSNGGSSSSSGVRSWDDLAKKVVGESGDVSYESVEPAADVDPESDKHLLREVLADEPSPSSIILKDPSEGSYKALQPASNPPSVPFELPPDLAAKKDSDSSILSMPASGPDHSGLTSDVFASSSRVDLLRPGKPEDLSSSSLQRTDELGHAPVIRPASGESSHTLLGDAPLGHGTESSAVDLGAHSGADLPFPLGLDSSVGSSRMAPARKAPLSSDRSETDSGTVDLLGAGDEFDLGLADHATSQSWKEAREGLPPTVPLVPAGQGRTVAWAGGGAAGLLAGVAICTGLWFAGILPNQAAKSTTTPIATPTAPSPELAQLRSQVESLSQARDDEVKKTAAATAEAQRVRDQLAQIDKQLVDAKAAATQSKQGQARADALARQVQQAESEQAKLKESVDKLTADKTTADEKLREANANLGKMRIDLGQADANYGKVRNLLAQAEKDASTAKDRLSEAEAAQKKSAALTSELSQRLRVAPDASPADVLAALDRALARPGNESVAVVPTRSAVTPQPIRSPEQTRQIVFTGINAYRSGNAAAAEDAFAKLAGSPEANAVDFYFLGLSQSRQGKTADADASFHRGWELEQASRPPPAQVDARLERLDRLDREMVNGYRR